MNLRARHTLAALALTAGTALGTTLVPTAVHAEEMVCPTAEELSGSLEAARVEAAAAKAAFKASNRPLGQLVKATKAESRQAVKQLQRSLRDLRADVRGAEGAEEEVAAEAAYDEARAALRAHRHLLDSKRALLAEIKAGRVEARTAWQESRKALESLRETAEACEGAGDDTEEPVDPPVEGDEGA